MTIHPVFALLFMQFSLISLPVSATSPGACASHLDCPRGWSCAIEIVPCEVNPQASRCVRKTCVANTVGEASRVDQSETEAMLKTDPGGAPVLRIQLDWAAADKTVWTTLHGGDWLRVLRGERQVKAAIRVCLRRVAPRDVCEFSAGRITFTAPVADRAGNPIQGSLLFTDPASGREVVLLFSTVLKMENH